MFLIYSYCSVSPLTVTFLALPLSAKLGSHTQESLPLAILLLKL